MPFPKRENIKSRTLQHIQTSFLFTFRKCARQAEFGRGKHPGRLVKGERETEQMAGFKAGAEHCQSTHLKAAVAGYINKLKGFFMKKKPWSS